MPESGHPAADCARVRQPVAGTKRQFDSRRVQRVPCGDRCSSGPVPL